MTEAEDPRSLITATHIQAALTKNQGQDARLISWKLEDFTKKGDNYASFVTSVRVHFSLAGSSSKEEVSYVAKTNPRRRVKALEAMMGSHFRREEMFYGVLAPVLDGRLQRQGRGRLRVPQCHHSSLEESREILLLEDLRTRAFRMHDRRKGLDLPHALLVMEEIARLHAASHLLQKALSPELLAERYPPFGRRWMEEAPEREVFSVLFAGQLEGAAVLAEKIGGRYARVAPWLRDVKGNVVDVLAGHLALYSPQFTVLVHNDCWTNNVLFSYASDGRPTSAALLDFQMATVSSPAIDITYFLYTSLDERARRDHQQELLSAYYGTFDEILRGGGVEVPFCLEELQQECRRKVVFGCLMGLIILPAALNEAEDCLADPDALTDASVDDYTRQQRENLMSLGSGSAPFRNRFLAIFEDLLEAVVQKASSDP